MQRHHVVLVVLGIMVSVLVVLLVLGAVLTTEEGDGRGSPAPGASERQATFSTTTASA